MVAVVKALLHYFYTHTSYGYVFSLRPITQRTLSFHFSQDRPTLLPSSLYRYNRYNRYSHPTLGLQKIPRICWAPNTRSLIPTSKSSQHQLRHRPKHAFEDIRSRNPTTLLCLAEVVVTPIMLVGLSGLTGSSTVDWTSTALERSEGQKARRQ